ncbi:uncharacterized protein Bfra_010230 [Botrytis fragariae]|uniref:Rhodopsin domain-containing protein n=1 Tax=Botrytis fragariae TaxID=1964551 RepID=A0A8H6ALS3_9HELO|nr:uncharacterized protein Bfra_010230 [Botrytis fragariae]KAF5870083.1 hypothetical protein Bfra_010230 [Botrytis fragariae]
MASAILDFPNLPAAVQQQILNGPSLMPPKGVIPNFTNPSNRNREAIIVGAVCLALSTAATLGRIYSRIFITKKVELQDYLGLIAYVAFVLLTWVFYDFLHRSGFYVHQWDIVYKTMPEIAKILTFGLTISYSAALLFAKTAILIEWVQIFSPHRTHAFFYCSAITCLPHESIWQPWVKGKCIDRKALGVFTAIFNVIMDLLILLLPQRIIWTLRMTMARKIGISLVFSVGVLAIVCAAGRVAVTFGIEYDGDATYTVSPILMWTLPEVTCVLLIFCLPVIPKIFTERGPLFSMILYARSWTRISTRGNQKPSKSGEGRNEWSNGAGLQHGAGPNESGQSTSITELKLIRSESRKSDAHSLDEQPPPIPKPHQPSHGTIIMTTEVEQRDCAALKSSGDSLVERQHPWMNTSH